MSYKVIDSLHQEIGKTIASERFLNTMDGFWFALKPNVNILIILKYQQQSTIE
jgi:hypothetical protein